MLTFLDPLHRFHDALITTATGTRDPAERAIFFGDMPEAELARISRCAGWLVEIFATLSSYEIGDATERLLQGEPLDVVVRRHFPSTVLH